VQGDVRREVVLTEALRLAAKLWPATAVTGQSV
jgi:hypothetical protein